MLHFHTGIIILLFKEAKFIVGVEFQLESREIKKMRGLVSTGPMARPSARRQNLGAFSQLKLTSIFTKKSSHLYNTV